MQLPHAQGDCQRAAERNLTIFGARNGLSGVRVVNAIHVAVENCTIGGMTNGIETISGATGSLDVYNSIIQGNTTNGILIGDGNAIMEGTRFDSDGLDAVRVNGAGSFGSIRRGVAAGNGNVGFTANAGYLLVSDSSLSNNYIGIAAGGGVVTVSNTMIASSSLRALYTAGSGQLLTFGNNQLSANAENGNFTGAVPLQ